MVFCPDCGSKNEENANFCAECGVKLIFIKDPKPTQDEENHKTQNLSQRFKTATKDVDQQILNIVDELAINIRNDNWIGKCPVCKSPNLNRSGIPKISELKIKKQYTCKECGAFFEQKGDNYELSGISSTLNPVWQRYGNQILTTDQWTNIANEDISDTKTGQRSKIANNTTKIQADSTLGNDLVECMECGYYNPFSTKYCLNCEESLKEKELCYFGTSSIRPDVSITNKSIILHHKKSGFLNNNKSGKISVYDWNKIHNIRFKQKDKLKIYFNYGKNNLPVKMKLSKRHIDQFNSIYTIKRLTRELYAADIYEYIQNFVKIYKNKIMQYSFDYHLVNMEYWANQDEIKKLRVLLISKGKELTFREIALLIHKEIKKQSYKEFKEKMLYNNPKNLYDYIENFVYAYGTQYLTYISSLSELLYEEDVNYDSPLEELILGMKTQIEMERFENNLIESKDKTIAIENIDTLNGYEFENFLKILFEKMGYNVKNTPLSGDQGADLVIERFGEKIVVQAKCYSNKVPNKAVQEVVASKAQYNADKAIVVTNNYFTNSAIELANSNGVELINRDKLNILIEQHSISINELLV